MVRFSCAASAATKYGVAVREITAMDDLAFAKLLIDTGTRRGYSGRNENFISNCSLAFHRKQAWFLIAELDRWLPSPPGASRTRRARASD